ncbi:hypothetical protein Tco_0738398, partial [Tanacetum coccineum]
MVDYLNDVNARVRNKAVKSVNKKEWKPIGKIFTTVGHKWVPIGRTFTIVGNKCPLTRIASTKIVPPRKPVKSTNLGLLTTRNPTEFEDPTFQILHSLLMSDAGPKLQLLTPGYISLVLVENHSSTTPNVPPSEKDWDILFQPLFDKYFQPPSSVVSLVLPTAAPLPADTTGTPLSTIIDQDAPYISTPRTTQDIQAPVIHQGVKEQIQGIQNAQFDNEPLIHNLTLDPSSEESSSQVIMEYFVKPIRRIQDFDESKYHCLTLKNKPYPHQYVRRILYFGQISRNAHFQPILRTQEARYAVPKMYKTPYLKSQYAVPNEPIRRTGVSQYAVTMDNPNITMEEYIRLEEEKAHRRAIVFNDTLTSETALSCEPTVSSLNNDEIDFRISFDESDDEDCTLPSEEFVINKLLDDAIGIYHRMFDFSGVRVPFYSFLLALIKHYRVHFSQLVSLGLNKRHPNAAIDDPRPTAGSFSMADVHRLSTHVIKLRDMPEGVLVLSGLSRVWKSRVCDPEEPYLDVRLTLQRLSFYCTPPAVADAVIPDPTPEDLAIGTPSSKILAKAEASQKRKATTSGATSSHVAKHTRSSLDQSFGSTTLPSLFMDNSDDGSDDDDDSCVKIPLVTPIRSATVIPSSGNQGGSSAAPTAEGPNTRDSRGKGIMADDAAAPSIGVSRPRPSSGPAHSFRDVSGDAIHADSSFFLPVLIMPLILKVFPTPEEMVWVESLSNDQLTSKMSVLHCMMMSHGGELLTRYRGLNQSHHEYVLLADSRLKGYEEKVASLTGLELQVSTLKKQVSRLNDKLSSSDASFAKSKAKGKERKKKIKSLTKSLDNLHAEVARLSADLNRATVLEAEKDEEILHLKATPPDRVQDELLFLAASAGFKRGLSMHRTKDEFVAVLKKMTHYVPGAQGRLAEASPFLVRSANILTLRDAHVSHLIVKESTVTPASESLELSANVVTAPSTIASEQNEEWVNDIFNRPDAEMTDGSERVSFGLTDVVVALSAGEKGDGSLSSSAVDAEATTNPYGV